MRSALRIIRDHENLKELSFEFSRLDAEKDIFFNEHEKKLSEQWRKVEAALRDLGHDITEETLLEIKDGVIYELTGDDRVKDQLHSTLSDIVNEIIKS